MHPNLLAVMRDAGLSQPARMLYTHLYANTNGRLEGIIPLADLLATLHISEGSLRRHRAALRPYAITSLDRGMLVYSLTAQPVRESAQPPRAPDPPTEPAPDPTAQPLRENAQLVRAPDPPTAQLLRETAQLLRETAQPPRETAQPARAPDEEEEINLTTQGQTTTPPPTPPTVPAADQRRALLLLTDPTVAMSYAKARECAAWGIEHCLAHILAWQRERDAGRDLNAGALAVRIAGWPAPALPPAWRLHSLVLRYLPDLAPPPEPDDPDEPDEPDEPAAAPPPEPVNGTWELARSQLRLQMTKGTYETWVRDTSCRAFDSDSSTMSIGVPNAYAKDWLSLRLRPMIMRTLASILGRPVDVRFEVRS